MSAEDRLREILHSEASTLVPAGDGLATIRSRVARRRRLRLLLIPSAAFATAAAVTAFVVLSPNITQELKQDPIVPATSTPTATPTPIASYDGPALWPFTSSKEAYTWKTDPAGRQWANDPVAVASRFGSAYLDLAGLTTKGSGSQVELQLAGRTVGTVQLRQFSTDGPWTVVEVDGGDLTITAPAAGAAISSPTNVEGRISGLHENVRLLLLAGDGKLADTSAPAGQEAPWQGTLTWTDTSWSTGGIIGITRSDRDGSLTRIVAIPVTRLAGSPVAAETFVGLVDGKVMLLDATDGRRMAQMTYPPAGSMDSAAAWAGGTLAWVRETATGCNSTLYRKTGSDITTVVPAGTHYLTSPQLSADNRQLAWVQTPCRGGDWSLVVEAEGGQKRVISLPVETQSRVLDVDSDGAVLLLTTPGCGHCALGPGGNDRVVLRRVPAGATSLTQAERLENEGAKQGDPQAGCVWSAAAFEGSNVLAGETCGSTGRLIHFNAADQRVSADPQLPGTTHFGTISVRNTTILVQTFDSDVDSDGLVGTYLNGRVTPFANQVGCNAETGAGCLRQPDW